MDESIAAASARLTGAISHLTNRAVSWWNLVPKALVEPLGPTTRVLGCLPSIQLRRHCGSTTAHLSCETVMRLRAIASRSFEGRGGLLYSGCVRRLATLLP